MHHTHKSVAINPDCCGCAHPPGAGMQRRPQPKCHSTITRAAAGTPQQSAQLFSRTAWRGHVGLRFVAFQPARGAQFIPGEGAYVTVQVYAPEEKLMLDVSAEGWDGARPVQTSFWPRRSSQFICPSNPGFNSKQFLIGYDRSTRTPYPQRGDPDVPFVRVELRVRPFDQACAPPTVIPGTPTVPIIEAVERLDWRRP